MLFSLSSKTVLSPFYILFKTSFYPCLTPFLLSFWTAFDHLSTPFQHPFNPLSTPFFPSSPTFLTLQLLKENLHKEGETEDPMAEMETDEKEDEVIVEEKVILKKTLKLGYLKGKNRKLEQIVENFGSFG